MNHAVKFVDVENMARWIQREGVENIITGMVDYLEADSVSYTHLRAHET